MPDTTKTGAEGVTWNLGDLYASGSDPRLDADLDAADRRADAFAAAYRGRIGGLSAKELAGLLAEYETIGDIAGGWDPSPLSPGARRPTIRPGAPCCRK